MNFGDDETHRSSTGLWHVQNSKLKNHLNQMTKRSQRESRLRSFLVGGSSGLNGLCRVRGTMPLVLDV
jgi:hypothetical protein